MRLLLITAVLLAGCGKPVANVSVDEQLAPYFVRFTQEIGVSSDGIDAVFADLDPSIIARCSVYDSGTRLIEVDSKKWAKSSENQREETIVHELGHCALYLDHRPGINAHGCPLSIMNPYAFGDTACYASNKPYYFRELKSGG